MAIQKTTLNFLVPAQGATNVTGLNMPTDGNTGINNYGVDFRSLSATVFQGPMFIPQACTIDLSLLAPTVSVTFSIPALGFNSVIFGGETATFQFPALEDLLVLLTPSAGTPSFPTFWYNYPALPSRLGQTPGQVAVTSIPAANLPNAVIWIAATGLYTTAGDHTLYTPGTRFMFTHLRLKVLDNSTLAAAGINTITLKDSAGSIIRTEDVFVPAAAAQAQGEIEVMNLQFPYNPYLSLAAGNLLIVNVGTAFTAGGIRANAFVNG